jgi:hypothetical protein
LSGTLLLQKAIAMLPRHGLLIALLCLATPSEAADPPAMVPFPAAAGTYDHGDYRFVLSVVVTNEGKVTEVGSLFRGGLPIAGGDYYRLELPLGSFIWFPPKENGPAQGWTRIGPTKQSRWSMALIEPNPPKDAKFLRTIMRNPIPDDPPKKPETRKVEPNINQ